MKWVGIKSSSKSSVIFFVYIIAFVLFRPSNTNASRIDFGLSSEQLPELIQNLHNSKSIFLKFRFANITLKSGPTVSKQSQFRVSQLRDENHCDVQFKINQEVLELFETELKPGQNKPRCDYEVELTKPLPVPLTVEVQEGRVLIENWLNTAHVKVRLGDIDVSNIGTLQVQCERCTLAGENINGSLHYYIGMGNIGLDALTGVVDGNTLGDTVLRWKKNPLEGQIKVVSRGGDVILFFPARARIQPELRANYGEIRSDVKSGPQGTGTPVLVSAEFGNVRLYRRD